MKETNQPMTKEQIIADITNEVENGSFKWSDLSAFGIMNQFMVDQDFELAQEIFDEIQDEFIFF